MPAGSVNDFTSQTRDFILFKTPVKRLLRWWWQRPPEVARAAHGAPAFVRPVHHGRTTSPTRQSFQIRRTGERRCAGPSRVRHRVRL